MIINTFKNFLLCDSVAIRTQDPRLRRALLYVIPLRFERKTHALEGRCSIQLSYGTSLNCGAKVVLFVETAKK